MYHICTYMCIYLHIWNIYDIYETYMKMFHNHIWFIYAIYGHIWPYMQIYMWHIWHIWENICLNIYATYMSTYKMSYMFRIFFHIWNIYACSVWGSYYTITYPVSKRFAVIDGGTTGHIGWVIKTANMNSKN